MITLEDLLTLPPSTQRDRLIEAERLRLRKDRMAKWADLEDEQRTAEMVTEIVRQAAQEILDTLPVDPPRVIQQRRLELLADVYPRDEWRAA